jgi:hypothetical protein
MQIDCRRLCVSVSVFVASFFVGVAVFVLIAAGTNEKTTLCFPYGLAVIFAIILWLIYEMACSDSCLRVHMYTVQTINNYNEKLSLKKHSEKL